jgi:ribosomal protein L37AE/L43A
MLVITKIEKMIFVNMEHYQCDGCGKQTPQADFSMTPPGALAGWVTVKTDDPEIVDKHYCPSCAATRGL